MSTLIEIALYAIFIVIGVGAALAILAMIVFSAHTLITGWGHHMFHARLQERERKFKGGSL